METPANAPSTRAGFAALIGAPNAGKSTLINRLVGTKVSIVSHKVQTTRTVVRGIAMRGESQIIFADTPGIFQPRRRLDRAMVDAAWTGANDADVVCLLIDSERGIRGDAETILKRLADVRLPKILILNKIDRVPAESLLKLTQEANAVCAFDDTFLDLRTQGCRLRRPDGPSGGHHAGRAVSHPPDQVSDFPARIMAAEITREKLFLRLHQELPYSAHVEVEGWEERKDGSLKIDQVIYIQRSAHKKIVIGAKGATIKAISTAARTELSEMFGRPVHLFLFVKVRENWIDDPERYREMGLEFPKSIMQRSD